MSYQLVKEEKHSFTVKHPDGTHVTIAKAGLHPKVVAKIKAMPVLKMADGGMVPDGESSSDSDASANTPSIPISMNPTLPASLAQDPNAIPDSYPNLSAQDLAKAGVGQGQYGVDEESLKPMLQSIQASRAGDAIKTSQANAVKDIPTQGGRELAQAQGAGTQTPDPMNPYGAIDKTMGEMQKSIKDTANASAQGVRDMQNSYDTYQAKVQANHANFQKEYQAIDQEMQANMKAISDGKIDPNRLWNEASTGSKVGASIGLVLSGIGSALTHQPNAAMEVIQKNIDRDVDSQKANLGKQQTLFSMNLQRYKNVEAAEAATRLDLNTSLQAQLHMAGLKAQSVQAQNQSKMGILQLQLQANQYKQQLALYRMNAQSIGAGSGSGGIPIGQDGALSMNNPNYSKVSVPLTDQGKVYQARTEEDAKELKKSEALYKPINEDVALLGDLQKQGILTSPAGRARAQAAMSRLAMNVNEYNGYNRFTDTDHETISKMFNNPASISSLVTGQGATADTLNALKTKAESERQTRLQGYRGLSRYNSFKLSGQ